MVPFWTWSSAQVTVTFLASLRVPSVTVRLGAETVPSATLLLETGITTFAVGWLLSRTVNVAVPRSEERRVGKECRSGMPAESLAEIGGDTFAASLAE